MNELLIQASVLGPAAAALAWLLLAAWPAARRSAAGAAALAAVAATGAVFWKAFQGESPAWEGLEPGLLGATLAAATAVAAVVVVPRAETLPIRGAAPAVAGIGAAVSAVTFAAYSGNLVAQAVILPVPTLAVALAALSGAGRADARGLLGLAAADVAALVGLAVLIGRSGSTVLGPVSGLDLGAGLVIGAAAAKAGALPGVATWRVAATGGPGAPVTVGLRAHGVVLAAAAGITVAGAPDASPLAAAAAGVATAAGATGLLARRATAAGAAVAGAGAALPFLALGLGGGVGVRAFLLLVPVFLVAAAMVTGLLGGESDRSPAPWRWAGALALGVGAASLAGLPPSGGFPGTWLALSLAEARSADSLTHLLVLGGGAVGLALGAIAAVPALRAARPRPAVAAVGAAAGLLLLYAGSQPLRLALGWLVRVERELRLAEVLPAAGAPGLPPVGGRDLLLAAAPAALVVIAVLGLGRGARDARGAFVPLLRPRPDRRRPPRLARPAVALSERARRAGIGFALAFALEIAAFGIAGWAVARGIQLGFL